MKFLVASMRHELLSLHHRLRREGHETDAVVWRPRYEKAWDGSITKLARHSDGTLVAAALRDQVTEAQQNRLCVLTNVNRVTELFSTATRLYAAAPNLTQQEPADRLLLGGWFDGESIRAPHLLVADWGAWTGGTGPAVLGGLTLIRLEETTASATGSLLSGFLQPAIQAAVSRLKSAGFRGLFHFDVKEQPETGEMRLHGLRAGWPWLHTQAFLAELEDFGGVLLGGEPKLTKRFVTVVPVSTPPWPSEKRSEMVAGRAVEGLTTQQQAACFWFDIQVDLEARKLRTAGLDGLLAVATGAADSTPALARARALELCVRLQIPEKQFRADVGLLVDPVLSTLEERWEYRAV